MVGGRTWFVVNARDAQWRGGNGRTAICSFEGSERFPQVGINVNVLEPGKLSTLYHAEEAAQEDFLVIAGTCLLLVQDEQHGLQTWDFVHCAPGTAHALVATAEPCVVVQIGARPSGSISYPVSELARDLGVGVATETSSPADAYGERRRIPIPYGAWLDELCA